MKNDKCHEKLEFGDEEQIQHYEDFLGELQSIINQFKCGIYNHVNDHICFYGDGEEGSLNRLLDRELAGAEEDLAIMEDDKQNLFESLLQDMAALAYQKITTLFKKDNQVIANHECHLVNNVNKKVMTSFKRVMLTYLIQANSHDISDGSEKISKRIINDYQKLFRHALESPKMVNYFVTQGSRQLKEQLQNEHKKQKSHSNMFGLTNTKTHSCNGPMIIYFTNNFDILLVILREPGEWTRNGVNQGKKALEKIHIPGVVAFDQFHKTFHICTKQYAQSVTNRPFRTWLLFELLCDSDLDAIWRKLGIYHFFLHLKEYAHGRSEAIIILPEWMPKEGRKLLKETLQVEVFTDVTFLMETTAMALGYLMRTNLMAKTNLGTRTLLVFSVINGFILVKLFGVDSSSKEISTKCLGAGSNLNNIRGNIFPWFLKNRQQAGHISKNCHLAMKIFNQIMHKFRVNDKRKYWSSAMDILIVSDCNKWKSFLKMALDDYGHIICCGVKECENFIIQGAAIFPLLKTRRFNIKLFLVNRKTRELSSAVAEEVSCPILSFSLYLSLLLVVIGVGGLILYNHSSQLINNASLQQILIT